MKKAIRLLLAITFTVSLAACNVEQPEESSNLQNSETSVAEESSSSAENVSQEESVPAQQDGGESNILVAYFSWADNAVIDGEVDAVASPSVTSPGNVQQLAGWVQEETGGDLFSIQVTEPYSSDWDECLERANQERAEDARPELMTSVENMDAYDTIFLGYPNWWYGAPMAVLSFLEDYDFSDKQVYLFCSHGTGGLANSVEDIRSSMPDGDISENIFDVYEEDAASSQNDIQNWLNELGY
ncbi:MAG TPA: flavodoxin [Firmicutes bacterium]|nr:flavodoxin [Bacillota bacterium]